MPMIIHNHDCFSRFPRHSPVLIIFLRHFLLEALLQGSIVFQVSQFVEPPLLVQARPDIPITS